MTAFYAGFSLSFSLILAIGAQNAFVLRQGLNRRYVFPVCLTCALSDALLIVLGVSGFYLLVAELPWLETAARYGGAAFLIVYGGRSFYLAWRSSDRLCVTDAAADSLSVTMSTCLALTWLNPHVYLDTVVLLGSVSTQYVGGKGSFAVGAVLASFVFFFALGYGARLLSPLFAKPSAWKILEIIIGVIMWSIALSLIIG